ncbi:uncharacterized protein PAE49_014639, partial [Odontesthes bonariensis]
MSETFNMPTDRLESTGLLPHRGGLFLLPPDSRCMSVSPDSSSSISNLSEREASVSPDINMECCLDECSSLGNFQNATLGQDDLLSVVASNMNQTFATLVNGSINSWNESSSHINNGESAGKVMCPDSVGRASQLSSCETSCRGSSENDCCSLSSGEMVIRSNSFCLEEQSLIAISSLEESSVSSAASHLLFPAESNLLSTTLPGAWEISPRRVMEENTGHPCLGVTFTHADNLELLTEENDKATSSSIVALPSESEGGLLMTFICESSTDLIKEAKSASTETELLAHFLGPFTPEQGKTFVAPMQGHEDNIHTSTPVQNTGNKTLNLPSMSQCVESASSPGLQLVKRQQISLTPKQHRVAGLPSSLSKVKKIEIQKIPKSDLSRVKSKVLTRASHQVAVPAVQGHGQALQQKALQVNGSTKPKEMSRRTNVRISPTKVASGTAAVSATSKLLYDAHGHVSARGANLSVTNRQLCGRNVVHGKGKTRTSPADIYPETMQAGSSQVSTASAQRAGSQTCASSLEKSPSSGQMDPKPTPRKDVSDQNEVRSGSALGQDKPVVRRIRPRCSSESSSTSRPPKKRTTLRVATCFSVCKGDANQGLNRPAKLNCSTPNKLVEGTRRPSND